MTSIFDQPITPDESARLEDLEAYENAKFYEARLRDQFVTAEDWARIDGISPFSKMGA